MRKKLLLLLIGIFLINLLFRVYSYRREFLTPYDHNYWSARVEHSQWGSRPSCMLTDLHINPQTCLWDDDYYQKHKDDINFVAYVEEPIGDDGLYAYAAWEYMHGRDPSSFNAEIPPLGKYLIGFTTLVFGNQNIFALLSGLFVLGCFFILNKILFKDNLEAFVPVFILSFDPLFYTQLRAPFLDLLYLGFLLLTFIFFLKERYVWTMIFFGCMIATKASLATFVMGSFVMLLHLYYMKRTKLLKKFLVYLPVSILVFMSSYIVYFLLGHNLIDFLRVQKWVINFYATGVKSDPGVVLEILFRGLWPTWWGETVRVAEWSVLWPIAFIASVYYLCKVLIGHRLYPSVLLAFWVISYVIFLASIPVWPRYLLLILPFMYTLFVWVLVKSIKSTPTSPFGLRRASKTIKSK